MCTADQIGWTFNNIVVVGLNGASGEAYITAGPHSVENYEHGRVTERVTSNLVETNREAQVIAEYILDGYHDGGCSFIPENHRKEKK